MNKRILAMLMALAMLLSMVPMTAMALEPGHDSSAWIYIGNGQFIHAPNSRSVVSYSDMSSGYWANHYYGARRIGK